MTKRMRKAGGILTIIGGIIMFFVVITVAGIPWFLIPEPPEPEATPAGIIGMFIALCVVALIGGIYALRRRRWRLALAGAICAALPGMQLGLPGIVAIVFISLTKQEFE